MLELNHKLVDFNIKMDEYRINRAVNVLMYVVCVYVYVHVYFITVTEGSRKLTQKPVSDL